MSACCQLQFIAPNGVETGAILDLSLELSVKDLDVILESLLGDVSHLRERDGVRHRFHLIGTGEIKTSLAELVQNQTTESVLQVQYYPITPYLVHPPSSQGAALSGHDGNVLVTKFSPDGKGLVTGSGDCTVRFWDLNANLPKAEGIGHRGWVITAAWSSCCKYVLTGTATGELAVWSTGPGQKRERRSNITKRTAEEESTEKVPLPQNWGEETAVIETTGWAKTKPIKLIDKKCSRIMAIITQPLACCTDDKQLFAAAGGNGRIFIISLRLGVVQDAGAIGAHEGAALSLAWTGQDKLISSGRDRLVKIWNPHTKELLNTLRGHSHWVTSLSLTTSQVLYSACYEHFNDVYKFQIPACTDTYSPESIQFARKRYDTHLLQTGKETLASCSDDTSIIIWDIEKGSILHRLTGHRKPVIHCSFSPDGRFLASASFDKDIRLWDALSGNKLGIFLGHVGRVYQICFSPDSNFLLSASEDSTLKVWNSVTQKLVFELPGHADEVFCCDWSCNGTRCVSGGRDKMVRIWTR